MLSGTIALDFDGTIHAYTSGWTGYTPADGPIDGALDFVLELLAAGYHVEIFSARVAGLPPHEGIRVTAAMKAWLAEHGFPPLEVTCEKGAHFIAFIDDRGVGFRGDYAATRAALDELLAHPKWWLAQDGAR